MRQISKKVQGAVPGVDVPRVKNHAGRQDGQGLVHIEERNVDWMSIGAESQYFDTGQFQSFYYVPGSSVEDLLG